MIKLNRFDLYL